MCGKKCNLCLAHDWVILMMEVYAFRCKFYERKAFKFVTYKRNKQCRHEKVLKCLKNAISNLKFYKKYTDVIINGLLFIFLMMTY